MTARQARALLKAAEAERAVIEVVIAGAIYRMIPASLCGSIAAFDPEEAALDAELAAFEAEHGMA